MRRRGIAIVALALSTALAGACTGELIPTEPGGGGVVTPGVDAGGGGPVNQAAKAYYDQNVGPLMISTRPLGTCAGCHQGADPANVLFFLGSNAAENYDTLLTKPRIVSPGIPAQSLLVTRGAHTGDAFEAAEIEIINEWINMLDD